MVRAELGPLWAYLPVGALHHDPCAYLKSERQADVFSIAGAG
jgi:hypothetical protein